MAEYLKGKRCYLSGPIQHDTTNLNWRVQPTKILKEEFGIDIFDPFVDPKQQWLPILKVAQENENYEQMQEIAKKFVRKDLAEVDHSHMVIACLPYKVPTTGTHHEIINANNSKKPTFLVCPEGKSKIPLWYFGFIRHEFMFGSWEDLYNYLREINLGKHQDNNRLLRIYDLV